MIYFFVSLKYGIKFCLTKCSNFSYHLCFHFVRLLFFRGLKLGLLSLWSYILLLSVSNLCNFRTDWILFIINLRQVDLWVIYISMYNVNDHFATFVPFLVGLLFIRSQICKKSVVIKHWKKKIFINTRHKFVK